MAHVICMDGDDLYLDDRNAKVGYIVKPYGREIVIGELRSPEGHLTTCTVPAMSEAQVSNGVQAIFDKFQQWAVDGMPGNSPLVKEWTEEEEAIAYCARIKPEL